MDYGTWIPFTEIPLSYTRLQQTSHLQQPPDFFPPSNTLPVTRHFTSNTLSGVSFFTSNSWKPVFVFVSMLSRTFSATPNRHPVHTPIDLNKSVTPDPVIALVSTYIRFAFWQNASMSYLS